MIILCEKKYSNKSDNFLEILLKESYKDKLFIHIYIYRYMYFPKFNGNNSDHLKYGFGRVKLDDSK